MRLVDLDVGASGTLPHEDAVLLNRRAFHIGEALRYAVCHRPWINAPFGKIYANLTPDDALPPKHYKLQLGVAVVVAPITRNAVVLPYPDFRTAVLDAAAEAFRTLEREGNWTCERAAQALTALAASDTPLFSARLAFSKTHRRKKTRAEVRYEVDETSVRMRVMVLGPTGQVQREHVVSSYPKPAPLQLLFPVARSKMVDDDFVLLDRDGAVLARVPM